MTVINSIREVTYAPVSGITNAANPVMGFNYGAQEYRRVRKAIVFVSIVCVGYMVVVWLLLMLFPRFFIGIFNDDPTLVEACADSMFIYFFGCFMMSLQMAGQAAAQSLGRSKQAIFFSLLRKVIIVIPADADPAAHPGHRGQRRVSGRSDLELHRRRRVLHHDALHDLAGAQTKGKNCAGRVSPRSFCVL